MTRATFSSECHATIVVADLVLLTSLAYHEVIRGPLPARDAIRWRDEGSPTLCISNHLVVDAMSLLAAVTAEQVSMPAEKSLL